MLIAGFFLMFVGLAIFLLCVAKSMKYWRGLVDYQFEHDRSTWVADGRPIGGAITRPQLSFWTSDMAATLAIGRWLWTPPDYEPLTKTHRVDFPFDSANPPFLDFALRPVEAP